MRRRLSLLTLMLAGCLLARFASANTTITVTNSADSGPGTLRQAIADSVPGDTISFSLEDTNTIALSSGQLLITNNLTIASSNATIAIDAVGASRVLEIAESNTVVLDSLVFTNGNALDAGGGILVDGGATLTLTNCTIAGNAAGAGGGVFISSNSIVAVRNCFFVGNSAVNDGGAIDSETNSTLSLDGSAFTGNSARRGGALFNNSGTNALNNCTLAANSAADGGAIDNDTNSVLTINFSTFSFNVGTNFGSALINTNGGTVSINASTFSSNSCPADWGCIDNWNTISLDNSTLSGNQGGGFINTGGFAVCNNSTFSGNAAIFDGGAFYAYSGTNLLNNCTFSGNSAQRRAGGIYENGSFTFLTNTIVAGNNAVSNSPNVLGVFSGANNLIDVDALLAPLGNYGGPTQTMPPLGGSPAINAGIDSVTNLFATDQRGFPRAASAHVDIGAVEIQPSLVMNANDDGPGSLREAIASAAALISFTDTLSGQTIQLTGGQLTVSNSVGIDASSLPGGVRIDAGGASRVMEITASNSVSLDSLTITNGSTPDNGGGILVDDGVTLTLTDCTVAGNSAAAGGGVAQLSGVLTLNNSTVAYNTAPQSGGGLDIVGGRITLNDCTLFGNSAGNANGGGIAVGASVTNTLNSCTITGNSAGAGGGIYLDADSISTLVNTIVSGNAATNALDIFGPFTGSNNLTTGNPVLAPLGNYGGPTQTMPPRAGSPAIDAGADFATGLFTDQRGYARLSGAHEDIGAVEAQVPPANLRPVLQFSRAPGGVLNFAFTSISNGDFTILTSTNLALPAHQWEILGTPSQMLPGSYNFTDSITTNKARFYRVVSP